jgi:hypothetical protein
MRKDLDRRQLQGLSYSLAAFAVFVCLVFVFEWLTR